MTTTPLAKRYATALVELAQAENCLADVRSAAVALGEALTTELQNTLANARMDKAQLTTILTTATKGAPALMQNFIGTVVENGRTAELSTMLATIPAVADDAEGIITAQVTSATKLTKDEQKNVETALKKLRPDAKQIKLETTTDSSLLGGMVVTMASTRLDASVRGQLNQFKQTLTA